MSRWIFIFLEWFAVLTVFADTNFHVASFTRDGSLTVSNAYTNGVVTIMKAASLTDTWQPEKNIFTTNSVAQVNLAVSNNAAFFQALAVDISNGRTGFTNLVKSYARLTTLAGAGGTTISPTNKWRSQFEGGYATNAELSRPHIAMADAAGNVYIADKEAHAIRKVTTDGRIHTVAGNNIGGNGPDYPTNATQISLQNPNGLWVRGDGVFYILDMDNGKIRKVDTNGIMSTLVNSGAAIANGRGLWVSPDESLVYYCANTALVKWTAADGLTNLVVGFSQLGNLAMDPNGRLVVTDRGAHRVYRIEISGGSIIQTVIAGDGSTSGHGGDGQLATATSLNQVRAVWFLPSGAYFLGTDNGSQVWYVDTAGYLHLFLNGSGHAGDNQWFYNPSEARVSKIRQITADYEGNLLITEHDAGYVRKVQFLRHME